MKGKGKAKAKAKAKGCCKEGRRDTVVVDVEGYRREERDSIHLDHEGEAVWQDRRQPLGDVAAHGAKV
jgi:hypothetical protein